MDLILATADADMELSVDALPDSVTLLELMAVFAPAPAPHPLAGVSGLTRHGPGSTGPSIAGFVLPPE